MNDDKTRQSLTKGIAEIKRIVTSDIQSLLADQYVPDFVDNFLLNQWAKLLAKIYSKNGMHGHAWIHAMETAKELIWSVGTMSSRQDRDRFDKLWPDLAMRLNNGMNIISMPFNQKVDFMSSLSKHRATLTKLIELSKTKNTDVTLIKPEKINALKMKVKQSNREIFDNTNLDSTGSEDITMPVVNRHAEKQTKDVDLNESVNDDITMPGLKNINASKRPFMDELLVDNHDIDGFKSDITGG